MKTFLRILGVIVVLIVAALFVLPIIFKDDIVKLAKEETNKAVKAEVDFGEFSLSLIKSFPDFYLSVEDIKVQGVDEFSEITMANIGELDLVIDVMSVIKGESIQLKRIALIEPNIHLKVLADGKANWDIAKSDTSAVEEELEEQAEEGPGFKMDLKEIRIEGGSFLYEDLSMPMAMSLADLELNLNGDMTASQTNLQANGKVAEANFSFDGTQYVRKAKVSLDAGLGMNIDSMKFTFLDNKFMINELPLAFEGWLAMPNDPIDMEINFAASETDFKEILSMIPAEFTKDLEGVKTAGTMALDGYVKGRYLDTIMPAFGVNLKVENAMFQYPDLPKSVNDINILASVESKDGVIDHTVVDVSKFNLIMAEAPFNFTLYLKDPISDPYIRSSLKGKVIIDNFKDVIPLPEGDELAGTIDASMSVEGRLSTLEKENYEEFNALGNLEVNKLHYASDSLDYPVDIEHAAMEFSPAYAQLSDLNMKLGRSDLQAKGRLENFIGYALSDKAVLHGTLDISSTMMDINELAGIDPEAEEPAITEEDSEDESGSAEESMEVVLLPKNIDFTTKANIKELIFDDLNIKNINGGIVLKDEKMSLTNTSMDLLDGSMKMSGFYETTDSLKPSFDFNMDILGFDVQQTVKKFVSVQQLAPIAKSSDGKYSTKLQIRGDLDGGMNPIYDSFNGKGRLKTQNIRVEDFEPFKKVAKVTKYDKINPLELNDVNVNFTISGGKVFVEPFDIKIGNSKVTVSGYNSFDQSINYTLNFDIPRKEFGSAANSALDGLLSQASAKGIDVGVADNIKMAAKVEGTVTEPKVTADFSSMAGNAKKAIKDQAKEMLEEKKKELERQAREEAEKRKKELEDKAKKEIEKKKDEAKKKLEDEAKKKLKGLFGK